MNFPLGGSTSTSEPTSSSASVRLKAVSRILVARPSAPFSFGDVTTLICRRRPFSSWWPTSGNVTKKNCPGLKSTSSSWRSKVTNSVPFATSRFSLIVARTSLTFQFGAVAASDSRCPCWDIAKDDAPGIQRLHGQPASLYTTPRAARVVVQRHLHRLCNALTRPSSRHGAVLARVRVMPTPADSLTDKRSSFLVRVRMRAAP